jgi:hypothetical protein
VSGGNGQRPPLFVNSAPSRGLQPLERKKHIRGQGSHRFEDTCTETAIWNPSAKSREQDAGAGPRLLLKPQRRFRVSSIYPPPGDRSTLAEQLGISHARLPKAHRRFQRSAAVSVPGICAFPGAFLHPRVVTWCVNNRGAFLNRSGTQTNLPTRWLTCLVRRVALMGSEKASVPSEVTERRADQ